MKARQGEKKRRSGAALPLLLLFVLLAAVGGTYLWAVFAAPDDGATAHKQAKVTIKFAAKAAKPSKVRRAAAPAATAPAKGTEKAKSGSQTKPKRDAATGEKQKPAVVAGPKSDTAPGHQRIRVAGTPNYDLPRARRAAPLPAAPDPALVQSTPAGLLPKTGQDGRQPWQVYARPFDAADKRPRIAIVISGLGINRTATEAAVRSLPGPVTLAFAPYADGLDRWISEARGAGHEVLLGIPMEPVDYPAFDPGPKALLTSLSTKETMARLHWALGRVSGYVGVVDLMGSHYTESRNRMRLVLGDLKQRGLLYLDSRSSPRSAVPPIAEELGLAWATSTRTIDRELSRRAIDARLAELERIAKDDGHAIGMGTPLPVTLERVAKWARTLSSRGIVLAPVSALSQVGPTG